ncbi:MAG: hypothetical protein JWN02_2708 [Acidobacteria bacterium]|nr:hypothetical protein [Acidobacteriota bacterium]
MTQPMSEPTSHRTRLRGPILAFALAATLTAAASPASIWPFDRRPQSTGEILAASWAYDPYTRLSDLGRGVGIVFTPDLSVPDNCRFYQSLGFGCFQDADWTRVLDGVAAFNASHPQAPIQTLLLETHGTNGNGLKLQRSYDPRAERSYISVGALQQRLEPMGVRYVIISACNSGRLLRPMIVRSLDPNPGDKLFLPATCGIVNATADFNPRRSRVTVITPSSSHIETSLIGAVRELAPVTRSLITSAAKARGIVPPKQFAVSDMLMQILLRDGRLELTTRGYVDELSAQIQTQDSSEALFKSFTSYLNATAGREAPSMPLPVIARKHAPKPAARTAAKTAARGTAGKPAVR